MASGLVPRTLRTRTGQRPAHVAGSAVRMGPRSAVAEPHRHLPGQLPELDLDNIWFEPTGWCDINALKAIVMACANRLRGNSPDNVIGSSWSQSGFQVVSARTTMLNLSNLLSNQGLARAAISVHRSYNPRHAMLKPQSHCAAKSDRTTLSTQNDCTSAAQGDFNLLMEVVCIMLGSRSDCVNLCSE